MKSPFPANEGRAFWDALLEAGAEFDVMPYGTEALHVMRAEKGFIMIGDETDGTVIPQDLNMQWAISKKKEDFLGKRAQERSHMVSPDRWKLVGLETLDGSVLPDGSLRGCTWKQCQWSTQYPRARDLNLLFANLGAWDRHGALSTMVLIAWAR
jgi:glycine cleavage system aminomethyltransferase T